MKEWDNINWKIEETNSRIANKDNQEKQANQ